MNSVLSQSVQRSWKLAGLHDAELQEQDLQAISDIPRDVVLHKEWSVDTQDKSTEGRYQLCFYIRFSRCGKLLTSIHSCGHIPFLH